MISFRIWKEYNSFDYHVICDRVLDHPVLSGTISIDQNRIIPYYDVWEGNEERLRDTLHDALHDKYFAALEEVPA